MQKYFNEIYIDQIFFIIITVKLVSLYSAYKITKRQMPRSRCHFEITVRSYKEVLYKLKST